METVIMSMESLSKQADYARKEIKNYLCSGKEGERIAGLAILQWLEGENHQNVQYFDQVLTLMDCPRSPYEHYRIMRVLEEMWSDLKPDQQKSFRERVCSHTREWYKPNTPSNISDYWPTFFDFITGQKLKEMP
jgi:hypothetical protein